MPSRMAVKYRLRSLTEMVALATLYVLAARVGLMMDAVAGFATLVWPPTGIALAALLIFGYRLWPGILVGAFVANVLTGAPALVALGIGTGNTLEALLGAYALRHIPGFRSSLDRVRDVVGLIVLAAVLSTAVSATIGVSSLYLGGIVSLEDAGKTWLAWWLGDLISDVLVAPVLLVWTTSPRTLPQPKRLLEVAALGVAVIAIGFLVFGGPAAVYTGTVGQSYMLFPLLIWAALRFGQRGAVTTAFLISLIAVWGTATGHGPFVRPALHQSLFALQTFMGVAAATFLVLGASVSERRRITQDLRGAISEQTRLHAERDVAHQRLVTVLEQCPVAIGIAEAASGRFLFVNDEVERLLGRRPTVSRAIDPDDAGWEGFHPDGRKIAPHEWPLGRAMRGGEVIRDQVARIERADGRAVEVAINAAPVRDASGAIIAGVVIFWDVTAQRLADEQLRRAHEAEARANRAKSEFLAVISHELRTPLNAILGYVELLSLGLAGPLAEKQQEYLSRIRRNQQHLLSLIDDVLSFAGIEAGRLSFALQTVHVCEALEALESLVQPELRRKELTYTRGACDTSLSARADPEKLRQILLNLLANAMKFTAPGGRISVGAEREGEAIRMWVSDTGIGMPADQLARVFEPFVQVEHGPTRRYQGIGLGLSIARDLASAMRGDVRLESRVGQGTTVSLVLPSA
jgi:PAS domain S-box-containing protein